MPANAGAESLIAVDECYRLLLAPLPDLDREEIQDLGSGYRRIVWEAPQSECGQKQNLEKTIPPTPLRQSNGHPEDF